MLHLCTREHQASLGTTRPRGASPATPHAKNRSRHFGTVSVANPQISGHPRVEAEASPHAQHDLRPLRQVLQP